LKGEQQSIRKRVATDGTLQGECALILEIDSKSEVKQKMK
jgi:hypothetical protein